MIKNKDDIVQSKSEKLRQIMESYANDMDKLSETGLFTIDNIERLWDGLGESAKEIFKEASRELIEQVNEKEEIRLKKANMRKKG